jgi:hypothetical protein
MGSLDNMLGGLIGLVGVLGKIDELVPNLIGSLSDSIGAAADEA